MDSALLRRVTLGVALVGLLGAWLLQRSRSGAGKGAADARPQAVVDGFLRLEAAENEFVQRHWSAELEAERAEDRMFQLWDSLNRDPDVWATLGQLPLEQLHVPTSRVGAAGEAGILMEQIAGPSRQTWSAAEWRTWTDSLRRAGWQLEHSHWRLPVHEPTTNGAAARSRVEVKAQLSRADPPERLQLAARLELRWNRTDSGEYEPAEVWVESVDVTRRVGAPPLRLWLDAEIPVPRHTVFTDPLICADLDGDGFSELLLVGAGRVWRNREQAGQRSFAAEPFPGLPPERILAAALTEVTGDGRPDLLLGSSVGLALASLNAGGRLAGPPQPAWAAPQPLKHPQVLAVGDVDGDGDADVWLAQYKLPYQGGQFPTPWSDANDGFASYLLLNDGRGHYSDGTAASGLAGTAHRRTYSASFIDLEGDGDLDLVNVSDFAGIDVFRNDGQGQFTDVTGTLGEARHAFGMAHAFADVNGDARPDLLLLGMDSPVAERLNALGLDRPLPGRGLAGIRQRAAMVHGNRLLTSAVDGLRGASDALAESLRRTGWTWGCAWSDFNNDGRLDLAVANGHETMASVRDYERQFWRHDLFVAGSTNAPVPDLYFRNAAGRRRGEQASYGGWQANQFLLSGLGPVPLDVAWLLGGAETADSRNLVVDDFDNDGRLDFAVTTFEQWPVARQRLLVFRNGLTTPGRNWIGIQLTPADLGARVEVQTASRRQVRWLVAGDSFRSQNPARLHFGLGIELPQQVELIRPDGQKKIFVHPRANAWQSLP